MSKTAEQKALEAYPKRVVGTDFIHIDGDANYDFRTGFIKGYYQAMQDFLEWLKSYRQEASDKTGYIAGIINDETIEQFKNYMENE